MSEFHMIFSAPINGVTANSFAAQLVSLIPQGATKLTIGMTSGGGNVFAGIAMYNAMVAMPYTIVTHNIGNVDSIAAALFLGGSERYISPAATFMFHGVAFEGMQGERLDENVLRAKLDNVLADQKRISGIFATRAKLTVAQGMRLFRQQRTRGADWAKEKGFVHDVRAFDLPTGGNILMFVQ
jgi:ATP-dependent protease ClpP protease subunit